MTFQFTPLIVPFLLSTFIAGALALYAWSRRRGRPVVVALALLGFAGALYALRDGLLWVSADLPSQYLWLRLGRPFVETTPLLWLVFAAHYAGVPLSRRRLTLLCVAPVAASQLAWTNQFHHLIWSGVSAEDWHGTAALAVQRGPLWLPLLLYQWTQLLLGAVLIVAAVVRSPERYRNQVVPLLIAVTAPFVTGVVYMLSTSPLDLTGPALGISTAAFAWAIFRHGLLDVIPAARHAVIENMSDAVLVLDQSHRLVDLNPAARRLLTKSAASAIGQPIVELLPQSASSLSAAIAGAELREAEVALDGRDYELRISPVRNRDGAVNGRVLLLHDITERKRAEQELHEAKRSAEEANRAKSAFLNTVSHELRTPLTSVVGFAKLIKKRLTEVMLPALAGADAKVERASRQVSENVDIIVAEGERLTTLINDVLDLAKIESGKVEWHMQPVAVGEIITRAIAATTSLSGAKGLGVHTEIDELPTVVGDPDRLIQVVINLLSNAIKFTATGSITCRAHRVDGAIQVSVTDTGSGIALEDQPKIFEQFVQVGDTLTGKPTGTGLGLPICKQIIEHHGGRIWVESAIGRGSSFAFTLPIDSTAARDGDEGASMR